MDLREQEASACAGLLYLRIKFSGCSITGDKHSD